MRFGWRGVLVAAAAVGIATPAVATQSSGAPPVPLSAYDVVTAAVPMSVGDAGPRGEAAASTGDGLHVAYTEAAAQSGQRSRAMATPVLSPPPDTERWPGLTVSNADGAVAVRASHPDGPARSGTHLPGGPAVSASATGDGAIASAAASVANVGGFAVAEELAGVSESSRDDVDGVVGRGLATVGRINILGGLISIEGLVTRVRVVSDGTKAVVDGGTTVNRIVVAGAPTSLTTAGLQGMPAPVETFLQRMGVSVSLIQPKDSIEGAGGSRSVGGILVSYDSKVTRMFLADRTLDDRVLGWLPDRWSKEARAALVPEQDVTLRFGQVSVRADATRGAGPLDVIDAGEGRALAAVDTEAASGAPAGPSYVQVDGTEIAAAAPPARFLNIVGGTGVPLLLFALTILTALALAVPLSRLVQDAAEIPARPPRR